LTNFRDEALYRFEINFNIIVWQNEQFSWIKQLCNQQFFGFNHGEESGESLVSKLRYGPEMVDSVST